MTRQSNIDRLGVGDAVMAMHRESTPPAMIATAVGKGITRTQVTRYTTKHAVVPHRDPVAMLVAAITSLPTVRDAEVEGTEYYGKYVVDTENPFSEYYAIARSGMSAQVSRAFMSLALKITDGMRLVGDESDQDELDVLMDDLDFAALAQDTARAMLEMGTVVVLLKDTDGNLTKPVLQPMDYITLLTDKETPGTVDTQVLAHGDVTKVVHDEGNAGQIIYERDDVALFRIWSKYNYFTDIKGRNTFGMYGDSMVPYIKGPLKSLLDATRNYNRYIERHGLGRLHIDMRELTRALSAGEITHADAEAVQEANTAALQKLKSTEDIITSGDDIKMLTPGGTIDIVQYRKDLRQEIDRALLQSDVSGGNVGNAWTNSGSTVSKNDYDLVSSIRDDFFATMMKEIITPCLEQIGVKTETVSLYAEPLFVPDVSSRDLIEMRLNGDITQEELRHRAGFPDQIPEEEFS